MIMMDVRSYRSRPNAPATIHPDKPWIRVHVDQATNFLGSNWLVMIDVFSRYLYIHATKLIDSILTNQLVEEDYFILWLS